MGLVGAGLSGLLADGDEGQLPLDDERVVEALWSLEENWQSSASIPVRAARTKIEQPDGPPPTIANLKGCCRDPAIRFSEKDAVGLVPPELDELMSSMKHTHDLTERIIRIREHHRKYELSQRRIVPIPVISAKGARR